MADWAVHGRPHCVAAVGAGIFKQGTILLHHPVEGASFVVIAPHRVLHHPGPICPLQRHYHLSTVYIHVHNLATGTWFWHKMPDRVGEYRLYSNGRYRRYRPSQ